MVWKLSSQTRVIRCTLYSEASTALLRKWVSGDFAMLCFNLSKVKPLHSHVVFIFLGVDVDSICNVNALVKEMAENVPRLQSFREALLNFPDVDSLVSGVQPILYCLTALYLISLHEITDRRARSYPRKTFNLSSWP